MTGRTGLAKREIAKRKVRRQLAMDRPELRVATVPRMAAAGPTSFPLKADDPQTRRLIDEALSRRARS